MERLHHGPEFARRSTRGLVRRIATVGGEETERHVTPVVVAARVSVVVLLAGELEYRQKLHRRDAELFQIARLESRSSEGASKRLGDGGVRLGEPAQVDLVEDVVLERSLGPVAGRRVVADQGQDALG